MLDLNTDVALELLLANILKHLLEGNGLGLLDVIQAFRLTKLIIAGVVVSLNDKVIVCPQGDWDEVADDVLEELEFSEALLAKFSYIMTYQYYVLVPITLHWNGCRGFEWNHAYMSS